MLLFSMLCIWYVNGEQAIVDGIGSKVLRIKASQLR
jgi:hypothetical protein